MASDTPDISQLSSEQQEALQTYTTFTNQDTAAAIGLLRRAEWNVQIAVTRFFEGEPTSDPIAEAQAAAAAISSPRQHVNLQQEALLASSRPPPADVAHRIDPSTSVAVSTYRPPFVLSILLTPLNIIYRILSTILSPFSLILPTFISRLLSNAFSQPPRPTRLALQPSENAQRFIREFNEIYSNENNETLPWAETGYNLALDNAKTQQKFLLIVLLSYSHDETNNHVKETLLSPTVREFINTHREELILWGGSMQDTEAYQVSTLLSCTKFPFAALICQTPKISTSSNASGGNMTVVSRIVGPMPASDFVSKLNTGMSSHRAALRAAKAQRTAEQAQRNLRQEQDSAYERSLAQDRERARKRKEEAQKKVDEEKEALKKEQEAESLRQKIRQWRRWRAKSIPQEPEAGNKDAVRVSIRMSDGERVIRKFSPHTDLEELYAFIECYEMVKGRESGEVDVEDEKDVDEPEDYDHQYKFQLVSPMPRTVFPPAKGDNALEKVGRGANLIVETLDDEDEEGEEEEEEAGGQQVTGTSSSPPQTAS